MPLGIAMNDHGDPKSREPNLGADADANTLEPLPGEPGIPNVAERHRNPMSRKGLLAVGLLVLSLVVVSAFSIQRFAAGGKKPDDGDPKRIGDRPAAATSEPRKLEMPATATAITTASAPAPTSPRIPALIATPEEAEPIGVRRTGQGPAPSSGTKVTRPEDAPVMLVTARPGAAATTTGTHTARRTDPAAQSVNTRAEESQDHGDSNDPLATTARNLEDYQRQLQGLLETLTRSTALATKDAMAQAGSSHSTAPPLGSTLAPGVPFGGPPAAAAPTAALFGGQLQGSSTPRVAASMLGNRSLTLPKGTAFTCALKTKVISATSGLVGCQVQRNVYSDDGRVLLIERGSHLDGEYRVASVRPGTVRIPVLWTRIRTPHGVVVDIESPGTGALGESGIDGYVDNRWVERIGAAMLMSLIDDSVKLVIANQASERQGDTVVLQSTTENTRKLAEKVLDSTINIPPLIYQNQGGLVGIYVARDVDFSSVYELKPLPR
jgi:type IV secretion system protein VirB10